MGGGALLLWGLLKRAFGVKIFDFQQFSTFEFQSPYFSH